MTIKQTIGIDISKLTFDVRIHINQSYKVFENTKKGFNQFIRWVRKNNEFKEENTLFALEHTGIYSEQITLFFSEHQINFSLISGLEIKRSLGIARGKDDKVDATKIALYAYRLRDEIKPYVIPSKSINQLKKLLALRERLVKHRSGFKACLKEQKRVYIKKDSPILFITQQRMIKYLNKQIDNLESEINKIIIHSEQLKQQLVLIKSIKGVGTQTALNIIASTNGFTKFKTSRQFASYCGIAPFPNSSGTSLNGRTKVSHLANKKLKSLLDLCAKSAIKHNTEMKIFYTKRVEQGKNKRSTINIVRNKLLSRIFAVVSRKTPYVDIMKFAT